LPGTPAKKAIDHQRSQDHDGPKKYEWIDAEEEIHSQAPLHPQVALQVANAIGTDYIPLQEKGSAEGAEGEPGQPPNEG
jgi:hypothetical protein